MIPRTYKVVVMRSFQKTKQVVQYEPIVSYCSVSGEIELDTVTQKPEEYISALSRDLDAIVKAEVKKTIDDEVNARSLAFEKKDKGNAGIDDFGRE